MKKIGRIIVNTQGLGMSASQLFNQQPPANAPQAQPQAQAQAQAQPHKQLINGACKHGQPNRGRSTAGQQIRRAQRTACQTSSLQTHSKHLCRLTTKHLSFFDL